MGLTSFARAAWLVLLSVTTLNLAACDHHCGLGEHDRVTVVPMSSTALVPGGGGASFQDVALKGATSDAEFSLSNVALGTEPGGVDAFLVPTTCDSLFDGSYPGGTPKCRIYLGPAKPGGVSGHVKLDAGTYRVYLQGYSNVATPVSFLVDVYIWDYSCGPLIQ
jgi:hypothetical protein